MPDTEGKPITLDLVDLMAELSVRSGPLQLTKLLRTLEKTILVSALKRMNWSQSRTADFLGMNKSTLSAKLRRHHIRICKTPVDASSPDDSPGILALDTLARALAAEAEEAVASGEGRSKDLSPEGSSSAD